MVGTYYAPELDATYEIEATDKTLIAHRPRGVVDTLQAVGTDGRTFRASGLTYRFAPNVNGSAPSFAVDIGRARGMAFNRVAR